MVSCGGGILRRRLGVGMRDSLYAATSVHLHGDSGTLLQTQSSQNLKRTHLRTSDQGSSQQSRLIMTHERRHRARDVRERAPHVPGETQALELPVLTLLRCCLSSFLLGTLPMHHTIAAPSAAMSPASGAFPAGVERLPCLGRFPCGNAYEGNSRDIDLRRLR